MNEQDGRTQPQKDFEERQAFAMADRLRAQQDPNAGLRRALAERAKTQTLEVVYTWPDGREEVRYRRPWPSYEADRFKEQAERLECYSWRIV
jgi:hypothetical protein